MSTIESLDRLRSEFVRLADVERSAAERLRPRRGGLRPRVLAVVIAIAGVAAVGAVALSTHGGSSASGGTHGVLVNRGLGPPWSVKHPFPRGRLVSLKTAQAALGKPIPLPHDPLTDPSRMGPISLVTGPRVVAISYLRSRVAVEYQTPVPYPNPAANYRGYVEDDRQSPSLHHLAYVGSVAGRAALVIRLHADSLRSNPASVEFVLRGMRIAVIGFQPAPVLLRIADSIAKGTP
jgi:hypothetical protein